MTFHAFAILYLAYICLAKNFDLFFFTNNFGMLLE